MATADPLVDPRILDYNPDQYSGDYPSDSREFDKRYLSRNLRTLLNVHTSIRIRWNIMHWVFTTPFVSREFADPELRRILDEAANRCKVEGDIKPEDIDPLACMSRDVPSLGLRDVCFSITRTLDVVPFPTSFEATCLRLQLDPENLRQDIAFLLKKTGIQALLDENKMGVKAKCDAPEAIQLSLSQDDDPDYSRRDVSVRPATVKEIAEQFMRETNDNTVKGRKFDQALDSMLCHMLRDRDGNMAKTHVPDSSDVNLSALVGDQLALIA